jgi:hypothetical protein
MTKNSIREENRVITRTALGNENCIMLVVLRPIIQWKEQHKRFGRRTAEEKRPILKVRYN